MSEVYIIGNIQPLLITLQKQYFHSSSRFHFVIADSITSELLSAKTIIVIEPFLIDHKYLNISSVWKNYLSSKTLPTKLVVYGSLDFGNSNYCDLLNLPSNIDAFLSRVKSDNSFWELPVSGANITDFFNRFFDGHGGQSALSALTALRQTINIIYTKLFQGYSFYKIWQTLVFAQAKPEFELLLHRWHIYYPYFEYLPFYPLIQEINADFSEISEIFSCNTPNESLFLQYPFEKNLSRIYYQLVEIDKCYIRPDLYSESQFAPDRR